MVTMNDGTYFCRRYQDRKRSMSVEELQEAFGKRAVTAYPIVSDELRSEISKLASILSANRLSELRPSEPIGNAINTAEVRKIMDLRFRDQIGERPYLRIASTPVDTSSVDITGHSAELAKILANPPQTRQNGWVIHPPAQVTRTGEGWQAMGSGDRMLILLNDGHLEYWHPCDDSLFQWERQTLTGSAPELYPFAVCELPVNFTRLARRLYDVSGFRERIEFSLEYANIEGFRLRPGVPNSLVYLMPSLRVENQAYEQKNIHTSYVTVPSDFEPDSAAFLLVEQVYSAFKIPREYIPCFEKGQRFDIDVNSSE